MNPRRRSSRQLGSRRRFEFFASASTIRSGCEIFGISPRCRRLRVRTLRSFARRNCRCLRARERVGGHNSAAPVAGLGHGSRGSSPGLGRDSPAPSDSEAQPPAADHPTSPGGILTSCWPSWTRATRLPGGIAYFVGAAVILADEDEPEPPSPASLPARLAAARFTGTRRAPPRGGRSSTC